MSPDKAKNERERLHAQVRFHRVMNIGLLSNLLLGVVLLGYVVIHDTTKIVPPEVKRPYEIGANYANKDYLSDMATYVLGTVMTVSPDSVDFNNKVILKMAHPDGYGALKTFLDAAAIRLKKENVSTMWIPRKEEVSEQGNRVVVSGHLKTFIADKLTSDREKEYVVEFTITTSGRLYVSKIEEVIKYDPTSKPASNSGE